MRRKFANFERKYNTSINLKVEICFKKSLYIYIYRYENSAREKRHSLWKTEVFCSKEAETHVKNFVEMMIFSFELNPAVEDYKNTWTSMTEPQLISIQEVFQFI